MRDYFAEFLLNPQQITTTLGQVSTNPAYKYHFIWAGLVIAIGFASWKLGQWSTSHKILNSKTESN